MGDVRGLLNRLGLEIARTEGENYCLKECPNCQRDKCYVQSATGLINCFHCGFGKDLSPYNFILFKSSVQTPKEAMDLLREFGLIGDHGNSPPKQAALPYVYPLPRAEETAVLDDQTRRDWAGRRGIESEAAKYLAGRLSGDLVLIPGFDPGAPEGMVRPVAWIRTRLNGEPMKWVTDKEGKKKAVKYTLAAKSKKGLAGAHRLVTDNPPTVLFTEGWRDVVAAWDNLSRGGYSQKDFGVVCPTHGALSWAETWAPLFENRDVYLCFDADRTGQRAEEHKALALYGVARNVYRCQMGFEIIEKKGRDLYDYLHQSGMNPTRFRDELIGKAQRYEPPAEGLDYLIGDNYPQTIADVLFKYYRHNQVRHRYFRGDWYRIVAERYQSIRSEQLAIESGRVVCLLRIDGEKGARSFPVTDATLSNSLSRYSEIPLVTIDDDDQPVPGWIEDVESDDTGEFARMLQIPYYQRRIREQHRGLPDPRQVVTIANGMLDVSGDEPGLMPYTANYLCFRTSPVPYVAGATCPMFEKFVAQFFSHKPDDIMTQDDDPLQIMVLQEFMGLCLTAETRYQKFLAIKGPKRSGKGVLCDMIEYIVGKENCESTRIKSLGGTHGASLLYQKSIAFIRDMRMPSGRIDTDLNSAVELILNITGEDPVPINPKHQAEFSTRIGARFIMVSNSLQNLPDVAGALAARMLGLECYTSYLGREDTHLKDRLMKESSGILNFALEGWFRLKKQGHFTPCATVEWMREEQEEVGSSVREFANNECELIEDARVDFIELYTHYKKWCEINGRRPPSSKKFSQDLITTCPGVTRGRSKSACHFKGIQIPGGYNLL